MKISEDTMGHISAARLQGSALYLTTGALTRPEYEAVDKALQAAGGKWDRRARAHLFEGMAEDAIEPILLTGEVDRRKQRLGQFDTPRGLSSRIVRLARIQPGMSVLEPSAGKGNLLRAVFGETRAGPVTAYEIDPERHRGLAVSSSQYGLLSQCCDFLEVQSSPVFDRVVMNPPFARMADLIHVTHAASFLKPGGRLVAIMSAGLLFRQGAAHERFRAFVTRWGAVIERLPDDSFAPAGTNVQTCLLVMDAPK